MCAGWLGWQAVGGRNLVEWLHNDKWAGAVSVFEFIEMLRARQCVSHMLGQISTTVTVYQFCLSVCQPNCITPDLLFPIEDRAREGGTVKDVDG